MNSILIYIVKSIICLGAGYIFYWLFLANDTNYRRNRIYLITLLFISLAMPFHTFSFNFSFLPKNDSPETIKPADIQAPVIEEISEQILIQPIDVKIEGKKRKVTFKNALISIYILISFILLTRLLASIRYIMNAIIKGEKRERPDGIKIIFNCSVSHTFTFFHYIVINTADKSNFEINSILNHEKVHAKQLHSVDLLFSYLVIIFFWFNPLVWIIQKSLQQVHEYLADKEVIEKGININDYQKMLLSIITEERLAGLSSSFNQSQIKKRLVMMTKMPKQQTKLKLFWAIPVIALVFIALSAFNPIKDIDNAKSNMDPFTREIASEKVEKPKGLNIPEAVKETFDEAKPVVTIAASITKITPQVESKTKVDSAGNINVINEGVVAVSPVKMNVFYVAVDNPVDIAISGVPAKDIRVEITNGTITGENGHYTVRPRRIGNCMITLYSEIDGVKKELGSKEFRVRTVPDPVAKVAGKRGGSISKIILLAQTGVQADMENFEFDFPIKVIEFTVTCIIDGETIEVTSKGNLFTEEQKKLIGSLDRDTKLYIQDIKAVGPDGITRDLPTITFLID